MSSGKSLNHCEKMAEKKGRDCQVATRTSRSSKEAHLLLS